MNNTPRLTLQGTVLIADDDTDALKSMVQALQREGHRLLTAGDGAAALSVLQAEPVDAVVTDLRMPAADGLSVLRAACARTPPIPVVIVTGYATVSSAVEALRLGAVDYLVKPLDINNLHTCVHRALERRRMLAGAASAGPGEMTGFGGLLGTSRAMQEVYDQIRRVAPFKSTVLITGESGTGKELVARAIHALSPAGKGPFVPVNCSALPHDLVESQLFGHEKGAFTGAIAARQGLFEAAGAGTLFLDEIGDLAVEAQAKLLRVLEDRQVTRVGSTQPRRVDVRLLAATNTDLAQAVKDRRFRQDLYYRLNVLTIALPPLRERRGDIPLLIQVFLDRFAEENGLPPRQISPGALAGLQACGWPGNVRELKNIVERLAVISRDQTIDVGDLPPEYRAQSPAPAPSGPDPGVSLFEGLSLEEIERTIIVRTLEHTGGNRTQAAKLLGISLRTLQRKLKIYGEDDEDDEDDGTSPETALQ